MRYELRIALRYLSGRRKQTSIAVVSTIAVLGVGLGVAALIIVTAVMSGFQSELRDRILGANAHIVAFDRADAPLEDYRELVERARKVSGVRGAAAFVISKAMARVGMRSEGAVLKGIALDSARSVLSLGRDLVSGSLDSLRETKDGQYGVVLGKTLAERLGAKLGDEVELMLPGSSQETSDLEPLSQSFRLVGVFESHMYEYDSTWAYTSMEGAQEFLRFGDRASGLEIGVDDIWATKSLLPLLRHALGEDLWLQDWQAMNKDFFKALALQKWAMFLVLCLIVMVAAFNVVSTLVLMVLERRREIGILKTLGASDASVRRVFLYEGVIIGLAGTALGFLLGTSLCWVADHFELIQISGEIYFISHLPFELRGEDIALICAASLLITLLTTLLPSARAARLNPVDAIRYE